MLEMAVEDLDIDLSQSFIIGDRPDDILCGQRGGCTPILVLTGKTVEYDPTRFQAQPAFVAKDVAEAVDWLLAKG
jgi:D-glycero-D-manno-heptose 1,7-bisphosphate phosphatase